MTETPVLPSHRRMAAEMSDDDLCSELAVFDDGFVFDIFTASWADALRAEAARRFGADVA